MAIVLTNGVCYITTTGSGKVVKTPTLEEAQTFYGVNAAMRKISKGNARDIIHMIQKKIIFADMVQRKTRNGGNIQRKSGKSYMKGQVDVARYVADG